MKVRKTEHWTIKRYANGDVRIDSIQGHNVAIISATLALEMADAILAVMTSEELTARIPEFLRPKPQITCPHCNGTGEEPNVFSPCIPRPRCFVCHGKRTVDKPREPTQEERDQWEEDRKRGIFVSRKKPWEC